MHLNCVIAHAPICHSENSKHKYMQIGSCCARQPCLQHYWEAGEGSLLAEGISEAQKRGFACSIIGKRAQGNPARLSDFRKLKLSPAAEGNPPRGDNFRSKSVVLLAASLRNGRGILLGSVILGSGGALISLPPSSGSPKKDEVFFGVSLREVPNVCEAEGVTFLYLLYISRSAKAWFCLQHDFQMSLHKDE